MQTIQSGADLARALRRPMPPPVRRLLALRYDQLIAGDAEFHVVEPGDTLAEAESSVGWPITADGAPCWEWTLRHPGCLEVVFVLSDDGPAQVLVVPDDPGTDPALLAVIREHA